MRIAFVKTLTELAAKDRRIMLLTGDLGFSVYEDFRIRFPKQYLNAGVAEQNMTGVSAGMALEGRVPIIYSILPFVTMRNFEQVRNDICYQNLNVKIVGVAAGFSYGMYGHTHYGLEDIALMRTLPNMTIFSPGDPVEVAWVTREALRINGPCYIRLGKAGEPIVHKKKPVFHLGKGAVIEEGKDMTIIVTGALLPRAVEVASKLRASNITSRIVSMHTIAPIDRDIILDSAKKTRAIFTLEEHFIQGGLGSAVAEVLSESSLSIVFRRFGVAHKYFHVTGSQEYMRSQTGLSASQLDQTIREILN